MKRFYAYVANTVLLCNVFTVVFLVKRNQTSSLFYANIEALAQNENIHPNGYVDCWKVHDEDPIMGVNLRDCFDCTIKTVTSASKSDLPCML